MGEENSDRDGAVARLCRSFDPRPRRTAIAPMRNFYPIVLFSATCRPTSSTVRAPDAIVVGSGPNGLAGALTLARSGLVVDVVEGAPTPGGGCRTLDLTLEGFHHDVCSSVHPLAACSPFFRSISAPDQMRFVRPSVAFAHPIDGGAVAA